MHPVTKMRNICKKLQEGLMKKSAAYALILMMFSQLACAQEPVETGRDWTAVASIGRGSPVQVDFKDGKT
jgi:hypothetical protein